MPKIGIVFDGGGGKGAYQIGVWKAMRETGLDHYVTAVSGASVGGLNACLFVQGDFEVAERIWTRDIQNIRISNIAQSVDEILSNKNNIDFSVFSYSNIECFIATYCSSNSNLQTPICIPGKNNCIERIDVGKVSYFNLRAINEKDRKNFIINSSLSKKILLATSALPILCKPQKIDGKLYRDGGIKDNSPVYPLDFDSSLCDTIIVIHLDQIKDRIDKSQFPDTKILEIIPNVSSEIMGVLSGTLNFSREHAEKLIQAGYVDSISLFRNMINIYNTPKIPSYSIRILKQIEQKNAEYLMQMEKEILGYIIT